jgi:O-antigen/teichoic acid export membrane protein
LVRRAERSAARSRTQSPPLTTLARQFWRFAAPRGLAATFQTSSVWIGILLVGALAATTEAGVFAAVNRFVVMGTFALNALNLAISPQISGLLAGGQHRRAEGLFQVATAWLMSVSWPLYLTLAVWAPLFLRLFGEQFVAGQHALLVGSIAMLINMATGNCHAILLMAGRRSWNLANTAAAVLVTVGLSFFLIPSLGATGAAIAWGSGIVVDNLATAIQVRFLLGVRPIWRGYVVVAGGAVVLYGLTALTVRLLFGLSVPTLLIFVAVSTSIWIAMLWRLRETLKLGEVARGLKPSNPTLEPAELG